MPYIAPSTQAQADNVTTVGAWPYPSVPNTSYNMVPLGALPYGDYSMALGDHLAPATKEKYEKTNTLMYSNHSTEKLRRKI